VTRGFDLLMVWTMATGGKLHAAWTTREIYEEARRTGRLNVDPWKDEPTWVDMKMVALAPLEDLRDFVLDPVAK
jgi:hypothetical protein